MSREAVEGRITGRMTTHAHRQTILRVILAAGILSTGLHFIHNYLEVDEYPQADWASGSAVRAAILVSWPLLTGIGLLGYRLHPRRRYGAAYACLVPYSLLGLATLGHFAIGNPDIPAFWYATIFTDGLAGLAVLSFVAWSALTRPPVRAPQRRSAS